MIVQIQLSFSFRHYATVLKEHLERDQLNVPEKATIEEVLKMLRIPEDEDKLFFVNDLQVGRDQVLQDGDVLHISPAVAGG